MKYTKEIPECIRSLKKCYVIAGGVLLIFAVLCMLGAGKESTYWQASVLENGVVSASCESALAYIEMPVYDTELFTAAGEEVLLCWGDEELSREMEKELDRAIEAFDKEGYRVGFLLYDLNSGQGLSYNAADSFYSASAIKGPYVACIAETEPSCTDEYRLAIKETISVSSNDDYAVLWRAYGSSVFCAWLEEAGCLEVDVSSKWTDITSQELALMWIKMYDYFTSGTKDADWLAGLYTDTLNSCISKTLGDSCTVWSKAGWIDSGEYYTVQNDGGIVMKKGNPYVFVILSDAYGRMDLLSSLIETVDEIHTELVDCE